MTTAVLREGRSVLQEFVAGEFGHTLQEFRARHPHPFLLLQSGQACGANDTSFHTAFTAEERTVRSPRPSRARAARDAEASVRELLVPVARRPASPFVGKVTVGRASNNDVRLPFEQVSKLHAWFVEPSGGGGFALVEAGSTNGTTLNTVALAPGMPVDVRDGDEIDFGGGLPFTFYTPEGLHRCLPLLARQLRQVCR